MAEYFAGGHLRFLDGEWRDDNGDVVEIREVKQGKWISCNNNAGYKCSNCKSRIKNSEFFNGKHIWCHRCGAQMREMK